MRRVIKQIALACVGVVLTVVSVARANVVTHCQYNNNGFFAAWCCGAGDACCAIAQLDHQGNQVGVFHWCGGPDCDSVSEDVECLN